MLKFCTDCKEEKVLTEFSPRSDYPHRVRSACKQCRSKLEVFRKSQNLDKDCRCSAKRRATQKLANPKWANLKLINNIYQLANLLRKSGLDVQVDHRVPLQSKLVCGLHTEDNLCITFTKDNQTKGNRHWQNQW